MERLSLNDVDLMFKALEAMEKLSRHEKHVMEAVHRTIVSMSKDLTDPEVIKSRDEFLQESDKQINELGSNINVMNDRVILLKAKLIRMRDQIAVEDITGGK